MHSRHHGSRRIRRACIAGATAAGAFGVHSRHHSSRRIWRVGKFQIFAQSPSLMANGIELNKRSWNLGGEKKNPGLRCSLLSCLSLKFYSNFLECQLYRSFLNFVVLLVKKKNLLRGATRRASGVKWRMPDFCKIFGIYTEGLVS